MWVVTRGWLQPSSTAARVKLLVVANSQVNSVTIVPLDPADAIMNVPLSTPRGRPMTVAAFERYALVPLGDLDQVAVVDLQQGTLVQRIPLPPGAGAAGAIMLDDVIGYVANSHRNTISQINAQTVDFGDSDVPMTDAHFHGVSDPMTGSLLRVPGTGNPLVPQACQRTTPIFDGRMRYNLQFAYKRMEQVKTEKGYEGPVVVCSVYFIPVAGYIPHRSTIKYLASQRDMEVWLAPIGSTRVLVPYRISMPTPIGMGVMQATQFVSVALPRAAAVGTKTQ